MNNLPADIKISILLAIVLLIAVVIFLLFIMVLYSRRQVLFEKEKELNTMEYDKQLLQKEINYQKNAKIEQDRISHDLHDDIGAGITALKLQTEFLKRKNADNKLADNIEELLQTCEDLHISMRQILWNLKVGDDNVENFTQRTIQYTKSFFAKTTINVHIFKNNIGQDQISSNTRRNVFLCIKEALNNVYKHSYCQNLEIHFCQEGQFLIVDIKDDGVGMTGDLKSGNGLKNLQSRMVSICGDLSFIPSVKGLHVKLKVNLEEDQHLK